MFNAYLKKFNGNDFESSFIESLEDLDPIIHGNKYHSCPVIIKFLDGRLKDKNNFLLKRYDFICDYIYIEETE